MKAQSCQKLTGSVPTNPASSAHLMYAMKISVGAIAWSLLPLAARAVVAGESSQAKICSEKL
jgi:hypothetical protein